MITVHGEHRNHRGRIAWLFHEHERTAICRYRVPNLDWCSLVNALPVADERSQLPEGSLALGALLPFEPAGRQRTRKQNKEHEPLIASRPSHLPSSAERRLM